MINSVGQKKNLLLYSLLSTSAVSPSTAVNLNTFQWSVGRFDYRRIPTKEPLYLEAGRKRASGSSAETPWNTAEDQWCTGYRWDQFSMAAGSHSKKELEYLVASSCNCWCLRRGWTSLAAGFGPLTMHLLAKNEVSSLKTKLVQFSIWPFKMLPIEAMMKKRMIRLVVMFSSILDEWLMLVVNHIVFIHRVPAVTRFANPLISNNLTIVLKTINTDLTRVFDGSWTVYNWRNRYCRWTFPTQLKLDRFRVNLMTDGYSCPFARPNQVSIRLRECFPFIQS